MDKGFLELVKRHWKIYSLLKKKHKNSVFLMVTYLEILLNFPIEKRRLKCKIISRLCTNLTNQNIHVVVVSFIQRKSK